jgi:predicted RNA-binding protein with TRAM domain
MAVAATKLGNARSVEIRVRFEPGLGMALYAAIESGEVGPVTVARNLGRGRALLRYHGFTLMAQGAPDWKDGETFSVVVKEVGPPLVLASADADAKGGRRVTTVDSAVVPSGDSSAAGASR